MSDLNEQAVLIEGTYQALLSFARNLDVSVDDETKELARRTARGIETAWYRQPTTSALPSPSTGEADVLPSEALFGFAGWLTSRDVVSGPFSGRHNATQAADLVAKFCKSQGWADPRPEFPKMLKDYPLAATPQAEPPRVTAEDITTLAEEIEDAGPNDDILLDTSVARRILAALSRHGEGNNDDA